MESQNKQMDFSKIAGAVYLVLAAMQLFIEIIGNLRYMPAFIFLYAVILLAGYAVLGFALIKERKNKMLLGGIGLLAAGEVLWFFWLLTMSWSINFFSVLSAILRIAAACMALFFVYTLTDDSGKQNNGLAKQFWFIPAIVRVVVFICMIFNQIFGYYITGWTFIYTVLETAGYFTMLAWLAGTVGNGVGMPSMPAFSGAGSSNAGRAAGNSYLGPEEEGYCGVMKHVLLLLFTFGIWYYIWIYRTTRYLNRVEGEEHRNPTTKLLLCMFVPFYMIYWIYKSAQRIDKLAAQRGVPSDLTTLCLILAILVGIIPPILMQDKMNAIVMAQGNAPAQPVYQQPVYQQPVQPVTPVTPVEPVAPVQPAEPVVPVQKEEPAVPQTAAPASNVGDYEVLKKYKELLDMGIITQEEFDAKKKEVLGI